MNKVWVERRMQTYCDQLIIIKPGFKSGYVEDGVELKIHQSVDSLYTIGATLSYEEAMTLSKQLADFVKDMKEY